MRSFALFGLVIFASLQDASAAVEWKLRLEGRIVSANSRVVRIQTAQRQILEIGRWEVPRGFDLTPGKLIRWISPEEKTRSPSGSTPTNPRK